MNRQAITERRAAMVASRQATLQEIANLQAQLDYQNRLSNTQHGFIQACDEFLAEASGGELLEMPGDKEATA